MAENHISVDRLIRLAGANPERADKLVRHLIEHATGADISRFLSDKPAVELPRDFIGGDLREGRTDMLFRMWTKDDEKIGFNLLVELKDSVEAPTVLQTMKYRQMIWTYELQHDGFVRKILTIVFYTNKRKWTAKCAVHEMGNASSGVLPVPHQPDPYAMPDFCVYDTLRVRKEPSEPALQALLMAIAVGAANTVSDDDMRNLLRRIDRAESVRISNADLIVQGIITYVVGKTDFDVDRIMRLAPTRDRRWWEENMTTLAQRLLDEGEEIGLTKGRAEGLTKGRAEGLTKGRAEGLTKGRADILLRLLERRFGEVPEGMVAQVHAADVKDLDRWVDAAFDADSIDDIFPDGAAR